MVFPLFFPSVSKFIPHKTCLAPPFFIEVTVANQQSEMSFLCILMISIFGSIYDFSLRFWKLF